MKRLKIVILIASLMLSLPACKMNVEKSNIIICSSFLQYDFVRTICGDKIESKLLVIGGDVHSFEPSVNDMKSIQDCKLFIYIGGEEESWAEEALNTLAEVDCLKLLDCIEPIYNYETEPDSHFWSSPKNSIIIANKIYEKIIEIDKENREYYKANFDMLINTIQILDENYKKLSKEINNKLIILGDGNAFKYLQRDYNFNIEAAMDECGHHGEPEAKHIAKLIDLAIENNVKTIFYFENSTKKIAETIADSCGAAILKLNSCHTITANQIAEKVTYADLMNYNIIVFKESFGLEYK